MLTEFLQDRAALYVSGAMAAPDRESFEVILEFHPELRAHVTELQDVMSTVAMARVPSVVAPPPGLKSRILAALDELTPETRSVALVVTGPDGCVQWVNEAFTAMCGYSLEELRGRKPGHLLQGPETDSRVVERIRVSLRDKHPCRETLVNYHKDGTRYRVDVRIAPVLDDDGQPLWFVAKEQKLPEETSIAG
jgi:PAS domain S-box-containing protein